MTVMVSPSFGKGKKSVLDFLVHYGCKDYANVDIYDHYFLITFKSPYRAAIIAKQFNGLRYQNLTLRAELLEKPNSLNIHSIRSKTIRVDGYSDIDLKEKYVWQDFWELGFIRYLEIKDKSAFIQFDRTSDADNAAKKMDGKRIRHTVLSVTVIPDKVLGMSDVTIPLIFEKKTTFPTQRWEQLDKTDSESNQNSNQANKTDMENNQTNKNDSESKQNNEQTIETSQNK